ncbi:MAG: 3-oxoacyl-ACP synthase III family protein [bacterium]
MKKTFLRAVAHYIPSGRFTNEQILVPFIEINKDRFSKEDMDFLSYGCQRKFEFLGVESRSYCEGNDSAVSMATKVALSAIKKADLQPDQIDCILFSAVSNPFREPSFATVLAHEIGVKHGDFFDINDTCNGFLKSVEIAQFYITGGKYKNILIVASENPYEMGGGMGETQAIEEVKDIDHKFSTFFAGSGAGALILCSEGEGGEIIEYFQSRTSDNWDLAFYTLPGISLPKTKHEKILPGMWADPYSISALIIDNMPHFIIENLETKNINVNDIDLFFTHQLGDNVTFATLDKMGVDRKKAPIHTFKEFGNLAAANLPVSLGIANDKGLINKGDTILLMSSACGLTYSCLYLKW